MNNQTNCPKGIARPAGSGRPTRCGRLINLQTGYQRFAVSHASFPNADQALTLSATTKKNRHRIDRVHARHAPLLSERPMISINVFFKSEESKNSGASSVFSRSEIRENQKHDRFRTAALRPRRLINNQTGNRGPSPQLDCLSRFEKSSFRGIAPDYSSLPSGPRVSAGPGGRRPHTMPKP